MPGGVAVLETFSEVELTAVVTVVVDSMKENQ